jgi:hypothetical protein
LKSLGQATDTAHGDLILGVCLADAAPTSSGDGQQGSVLQPLALRGDEAASLAGLEQTQAEQAQPGADQESGHQAQGTTNALLRAGALGCTVT